MRELKGKIAVVTGAGSGIGQALAELLVQGGCHVALCDINREGLDETIAHCRRDNSDRVDISGFCCDVANEDDVQTFVEHVRQHHKTTQINLLINNAGINGGGSFVNSTRDEWERTFNICFTGTYLMTRHFLPMLMNSEEGHVVNMSSANAIRAVLGGQVPHTAYSTAKFAVRGFSESLIHDFRFNAPHLGVSVVMPGHTGTDIIVNSLKILGGNEPASWSEQEVAAARSRYRIAGREDADSMSADEIWTAGVAEAKNMKQLGLPAADAAKQILDGVTAGRWRILIGRDTETLDELVRASPESAYDPDFVDRWREAAAARPR